MCRRLERIVSLRLGRIVSVLAVAAFALGPLSAKAAATITYAGTVRSVDSARGSFMLEDVGPWHGGPDANITNRAIVLTSSTKLAMASRTWSSATKFPGDYEEIAARRTDLKEGAFVSVECQPTGESCRAVKLTVVQPE